MQFTLNRELLNRSRAALFPRKRLFWIVGGAGSGKTTICHTLSAKFELPVYDMDAHVFGSYHGRFSSQRHPANKAWSNAPNPFTWLLEKSWAEFYNFNRAALPEYLDLLSEDLKAKEIDAPLLIDGGVCNPAILAKVMPTPQIICLARPERTSAQIWSETAERKAMKELVNEFPNPELAWRKFLEFDEKITNTILTECEEHNISVLSRVETDPVELIAKKVAVALKLISPD